MRVTFDAVAKGSSEIGVYTATEGSEPLFYKSPLSFLDGHSGPL